MLYTTEGACSGWATRRSEVTQGSQLSQKGSNVGDEFCPSSYIGGSGWWRRLVSWRHVEQIVNHATGSTEAEVLRPLMFQLRIWQDSFGIQPWWLQQTCQKDNIASSTPYLGSPIVVIIAIARGKVEFCRESWKAWQIKSFTWKGISMCHKSIVLELITPLTTIHISIINWQYSAATFQFSRCRLRTFCVASSSMTSSEKNQSLSKQLLKLKPLHIVSNNNLSQHRCIMEGHMKTIKST